VEREGCRGGQGYGGKEGRGEVGDKNRSVEHKGEGNGNSDKGVELEWKCGLRVLQDSRDEGGWSEPGHFLGGWKADGTAHSCRKGKGEKKNHT